MSTVFPGRGITITNQSTWVINHQIEASEISITTGQIGLDMIDSTMAQKGDILMYSEYGYLEWAKPFDSDAELRREYPALEEAWGTLMEALSEYELVKKLVQDHEKS